MVLIGSMLLTSLFALGEGFNYNIDRQFAALAPDVLTLTPSPLDAGPGGPGNDPGSPDVPLDVFTVREISRIEGVREVVPSVREGISLVSRGQTLRTALIGMDSSQLPFVIPTLTFAEGGYPNPSDPTKIILGWNVANPAGEVGGFAATGEVVRVEVSRVKRSGNSQELVVEKKSYVVSGVIEETGNPIYDSSVVVSLPSANGFLDKSNEFDQIFVVTEDSDINEDVEEAIREIYGNGIGITTPKALQDTIREFVGTFNVFLSSIGFISLIVGGVGIVTTLFTSVIERTRELGTLKAIGATNGNIVLLVLFESLTIGVLGATGGLLGGYGMGWALTSFLGQNFGELVPIFLPVQLASVWLVTVALSALAGIYPAWKAAKLPPVVALRQVQ